MSSGGSNSKSIDPGAIVRPPALDNNLEPSGDEDDGVSSMQTSDMYNKPIMCERAGRLKTIDQLTLYPMDLRRELAKTIILHDYPLSMVDHRGFKGLLESVYPMVSQNTLKCDISKIYEFEKDVSMLLFNETDSKIAVTVDKFASCDQTKKYIAITGQMINSEWQVQRRMMRFLNLPRGCTNELVAKLTVKCLFDWDVASKISTIAIDDAFDEGFHDFLVDQLPSSSLLLGGKLLQMRCFARTVSLMVKEGFHIIESVIDNIRESILFWTDTRQRERKLKEASLELSMSDSDSKLVLDCVAKWNTTFLMLETALLYKPVFSLLKKEESEYLCMPSEEEWELAKEICQKLRLFYKVMHCASKYHSGNKFFIDLCKIKLILRKWVSCSNEQVRNMALKMLEIFDKYWNSVRDVFAIASVLDERYKLVEVEDFFQEIYGDESQKEVEHIRQLCYDLFNEYQIKVSLEKKQNDENSSGLEDSGDKIEDTWETYCRKKRKRELRNSKPELDVYLETGIISVDDSVEDIAVLNWWRYRYNTILKKMVKDIMAIPIMSVAPEHMFDTGEFRLLSPHRSRLHPIMVEKLMCTQSWFWTDIKGAYMVTNSFSWGTSDDYTVVEQQAAADEAVD
ncbi:zinc finger BED domain-containing protein RICESLEEPER 2 [Beta vulgaris subsp. vulgaris]|uniref:zinc finger BED domain-containing protein RICESLEEPER 2 n=1 Tax=Beta vulgaris subsp. vulgaris TaxID=3555 RepID=UPI002036A4F4|nr:zinc finger BED domain-containing protein RICESLEEPER 2 [Beta vulgaris subsp. vulgaris]XP_048497541.1 zinc finger BED domain-containing protein RICESLEEPER 2 [Beta vulgaris subsp. vulgaris]XP_048497544.1 zinc finger BED domain-containing protein RICESLEEPER 2 [Beta vulgaris subsp. vulgaris]